MSLHARLTLLQVLVLAFVLVSLSLGLYYATSFALNAQVRQDLENRAADVKTSLVTALAVQSDPVTVLRQGGLVIPSADAFASGDLYVQIVSLDGTILTKSNNLGAQRMVFDRSAMARVSQGESTYYEFRSGETRLRALVTPLVVNGRPVAAVEVAQSLRQMDLTLTLLASVLAVVVALSLALAAALSALVARRALQPIDRITQTARQISRANDLARRLEPVRSEDEVGRLVQTLNEMLGRIQELFQSQQRFVADVSHELRTPLTVIQGNLDLLRNNAAGDDSARQQAWRAIEGETDRMRRLVSDLLLLAQADAGVPIRREPVELDTLLLEVYRHAKLMSRGVRVYLGHEDRATVLGDADRLKQLWLNLAENALKYTPVGGSVELSLFQSEGQARLVVRDTGIGIAQEDLPHLFDRFYRVDKARSRASGGTGLGLAIVRHVAESHGGGVHVESELGRGSTFTVTLPLAPGSASPPVDFVLDETEVETVSKVEWESPRSLPPLTTN